MTNLDYISADINPENAMVQMDIQEIIFEDCYFDFILCIGENPSDLGQRLSAPFQGVETFFRS